MNYNKSKSSCIIFLLNCLKYFQKYIIHKRIETFWSRHVIDKRILG